MQKSVEEMTQEELMDRVEELEADLEEERRVNAEMHQRLLDAADVMACTCRIHNTPYAKSEWIRRGTVHAQTFVS